MLYRLVAVDLDGTLLDSVSRIPEATARAIRDFRRLGGFFTLATGRSEDSTRAYAEELGLDEPLIAFNGGKVMSLKTGEVFYETFLDSEKGVRAFYALRALGKDVVVYRDGVPHVSQMTDVVERYQRRIKLDLSFISDARETIGTTTKKLLVIDPAREFGPMADAVRPIFGDSLNCVNSDDYFFEVLPPLTSKAHGLLLVAERLGVPVREVVAVGDHLNDVPMIEAAGVGVAVANATQAALDAADYVTASNDEDGVGKLLRRIIAGESLP